MLKHVHDEGARIWDDVRHLQYSRFSGYRCWAAEFVGERIRRGSKRAADTAIQITTEMAMVTWLILRKRRLSEHRAHPCVE
jgi:hypothetical protein